jgi:hypothetical protein
MVYRSWSFEDVIAELVNHGVNFQILQFLVSIELLGKAYIEYLRPRELAEMLTKLARRFWSGTTRYNLLASIRGVCHKVTPQL